MKYPINSTPITEARLYCAESYEHTYDYDGWSDAYQKAERIISGKFCQLWLGEFCKANNIKYVADTSSPYKPDKQDISINGWNIDCKCSAIPGLEGQITKEFDNPDNSIDYYAFFNTDKKLTFIEPLGFIHKSNVLKSSVKILKNNLIPGTKLKQRFEYSYFVDTSALNEFNNSIEILKNHCK